jgi:hypothetical protein
VKTLRICLIDREKLNNKINMDITGIGSRVR